MRRVLIGLVPIIIMAVYAYGWRVMALLAIAGAVAVFTEWLFLRPYHEPVSSAVLVTSTLFVLSLPPALPYWMAVVGILFAVIFGKMVFGGFGKNIFNPALTGRAFIYVSFAGPMTSQWTLPFNHGWGGFLAYAPSMPDAVTTATPGMLLKTGESFAIMDLAFGHLPGTIGGTYAWAVLLGGLYIVFTRTANFRIVIGGLLGYLIAGLTFWLAGAPGSMDPLRGMLAGSFLVGIFFYATDPVSASQTNTGRWIYGAFVGALSSVIGTFSAWPAGTMFAILLANMFAPLMDIGIRRLETRNGEAAS